MADQADLVEVGHTLRQVLIYKGVYVPPARPARQSGDQWGVVQRQDGRL
jgi:hypothetical protein